MKKTYFTISIFMLMIFSCVENNFDVVKSTITFPKDSIFHLGDTMHMTLTVRNPTKEEKKLVVYNKLDGFFYFTMYSEICQIMAKEKALRSGYNTMYNEQEIVLAPQQQITYKIVGIITEERDNLNIYFKELETIMYFSKFNSCDKDTLKFWVGGQWNPIHTKFLDEMRYGVKGANFYIINPNKQNHFE